MSREVVDGWKVGKVHGTKPCGNCEGTKGERRGSHNIILKQLLVEKQKARLQTPYAGHILEDCQAHAM